jgi:hypothetical protein
MSNCKSELGLNHFWVDVTKKDDIYNSLYCLIDCDNDLTENEDYFRGDTLELGYKDEADRIVKEYLKENKVNGVESFKKAVKEISETISNQDFFGNCELSIVTLSDSIVVIAFAYGGRYDFD